jgi:hypothetical protein
VRRAEGERLSGPLFFVISFLAVTAVGGLAALVTWAFHPTPKPACTIDCPPPGSDIKAALSPLREHGSFTSSQYHFTVEYPSGWSVRDSGSAGALFATARGLVEFVGSAGAGSGASLIAQRVSKFDPNRLPDIRALGPLHGAHIGSQEGIGTLYAATYVPPSGGGSSLLVRIGIIAATRGNLTVLATAVLPYDQGTGTLADAKEVDYGLTEFRWPGE